MEHRFYWMLYIILNFGLRKCKKFLFNRSKINWTEKKPTQYLGSNFFNFFSICILSVIFREHGHKMCRNGTSYDFSIIVNAKYFRIKYRNGISYDILSKIGLLRNAVLALFTTPGTIELNLEKWQRFFDAGTGTGSNRMHVTTPLLKN